jgi:hypothetical protein
MPMGLSEKAHELLRALPDDGNPFVRDGRRTYLRYDSMVIEPIFDAGGGVNVGYKWRGTVMYRHRIEGFDVKEGTGVLNLWGVEGRMRLIRDGESLSASE